MRYIYSGERQLFADEDSLSYWQCVSVLNAIIGPLHVFSLISFRVLLNFISFALKKEGHKHKIKQNKGDRHQVRTLAKP